MTLAYVLTASAIALVLLAWGAWSAYAVWTELRGIRAHMGKLAGDQRGLRLQTANMIGMLQRAGFKRGPTIDWSDDGQRTQIRGESNETKWDWRAPADEGRP